MLPQSNLVEAIAVSGRDSSNAYSSAHEIAALSNELHLDMSTTRLDHYFFLLLPPASGGLYLSFQIL